MVQRTQSDYAGIMRAVEHQSAWKWAQRPGNLAGLKAAYAAIDLTISADQFLSQLLVSELKTLKGSCDDAELTVKLKAVAPRVAELVFVLQKEIKKTLDLHAIENAP